MRHGVARRQANRPFEASLCFQELSLPQKLRASHHIVGGIPPLDRLVFAARLRQALSLVQRGALLARGRLLLTHRFLAFSTSSRKIRSCSRTDARSRNK